ncbi:hypothetical protein M501DRAFT_815685 [Patellaria atrata CBS 101060]|uniref:RecQ-mediated genome instability protein 1 n=1 Tax=Patellaria atrata CBS 101060 TaxID=1346257 RepID=A0A9P4S9X0_9PEZI|nr:hypothetical protein M501DRAFT_815685 [Patellaria atrata CBS 101060]
MTTTNLAQEISTHLASKSLYPSQGWLDGFLTSIRIGTALPALKSTAQFRILASDITQTLDRSVTAAFPPDVLDATKKERILPDPIPVQVLDVEDIGRSRWSQVEAIEAAERGETTKGKEIIRVVQSEEQGERRDDEAAASGGPHKVLVQDVRGSQVYGIEMFPVQGMDLSMGIGSKLLLNNVVLARGVLLLDANSTTVVGGRIATMHEAWKAGRKARLKKAANEKGV